MQQDAPEIRQEDAVVSLFAKGNFSEAWAQILASWLGDLRIPGRTAGPYCTATYSWQPQKPYQWLVSLSAAHVHGGPRAANERTVPPPSGATNPHSSKFRNFLLLPSYHRQPEPHFRLDNRQAELVKMPVCEACFRRNIHPRELPSNFPPLRPSRRSLDATRLRGDGQPRG